MRWIANFIAKIVQMIVSVGGEEMFGPSAVPEPQKDDFWRPETLDIVQDFKNIKNKIDALLNNNSLHPAARAFLQGCKDKLDQAALSAHHAGNL